MYNVIDIRTNNIVGVYKTLKTARRAADRKDMEYGAIRYAVRRAIQSLEG